MGVLQPDLIRVKLTRLDLSKVDLIRKGAMGNPDIYEFASGVKMVTMVRP